MSTQQKSGGGGRKSNKSGGSSTGQLKDNNGIGVSDQQTNSQNQITSKKHTSNANAQNVNNNNTDQLKPEKEKAKPTAEQIRIAQITEIKSGAQDPTREKVDQLMEATARSEEDCCLALYECDNDVDGAVMYLLDNLEVGALVTKNKKKKNKVSAADGTGDGDEFESNDQRGGAGHSRDSDRSRGNRVSSRGGRPDGSSNRGRSRPGGDSRDDRGSGAMSDRPLRGTGPRRGGFSNSRGGRGGRMGPRGTGYRDQNHRSNYRTNTQEQPQEIDNWDPASTQIVSSNDNTSKNDETWGDWDNEEYTGSLSDTKVFTPSGATQPTAQDLAAPPGLEQQILNPPSQNDVQQYSTTVVSSTSTAAVIQNNGVGQYPEIHSGSAATQQLRQALDMPHLNQQSGSLSAEQSQYFNTLGAQNTTGYSSAVQYPYGDQVVTNQQAPRQSQQRTRARVPPPSKIPSSAVEMPGDALNVQYLDVQFGALDFGTGTEETYDAEKYSTSIDQSTGDDYSTKGTTKSSQPTGLGGLQNPLIQNADSITSSAQGDLSSGYAQRNPNVSSSMGSAGGQSALDQLSKPGADMYNHGTVNQTTGAGNYQNLSYSTTQKSGGYQTAGYGTNAYNSTQTSNNNYPPSSNSYGGYNQNSYQQQNQATQNATGQQTQTGATGNVVVPSNAVSQSVPVNSSTGYMSNQYPVNQSGFPSQQTYQNQNVYGNTTGLSNNTDRYSGSINSLTSKLKGTPGAFDSSNSAVSSVTSSVSSNAAITTSSINTSSLGLNATKSTAPTTMKTGSSQVTSVTGVTTNTTGVGAGTTGGATGNGSNIVQNIPLVSSTYIQPAAAFFGQQPYLHFEDLNMLQTRMTPMTGFYEYQTPTSLAAGVRNDGTAASNLAYPLGADGRFARTDNNSSPVQSQTGNSQQMMNLPPYAYFYGTNVMPSGFQQFTPQLTYSQMPAANPNAGQFAKQSAYNSGYGSTGYDALNQTAPDYNKTAYQTAGQQAKGHSVTSNQTAANSDIASSMYNKSHVTLNKVNSYDKQSFHSGTPPPFNLAGSQAGTQQQAYQHQQHLYLQPMAPHHNMNMHQQIHQMDGSRLANTRRDTNSSGQRQQSSNQSKTGSKPGYSPSAYWNTQN